MIIRFLIDKYVKKQEKKLFAYFVDLNKTFDMVPRNKLFYTLQKNYSVEEIFFKFYNRFNPIKKYLLKLLMAF